MSLWIEWETEVLPEDRDKLNGIVQKAVEAALDYEKVEVPCELSLTVVEEDVIREINLEQRNIDAVTDVLSFPMLDYEEEEEPWERVSRAFREGEIDPETEEVVLGDIVICYKRAMEQAEAYGHSIEREMAFLAVHSVLHLLGYDHMEEEEEKDMFDRQEKVLTLIGLTRNS